MIIGLRVRSQQSTLKLPCSALWRNEMPTNKPSQQKTKQGTWPFSRWENIGVSAIRTCSCRERRRGRLKRKCCIWAKVRAGSRMHLEALSPILGLF